MELDLDLFQIVKTAAEAYFLFLLFTMREQNKIHESCLSFWFFVIVYDENLLSKFRQVVSDSFGIFPFHLPSYYCSEDTRPGLVPKHIARQHKQEAKQKELNEVNKIKPKKVLEKEKREEGLSKTIGAENKRLCNVAENGF